MQDAREKGEEGTKHLGCSLSPGARHGGGACGSAGPGPGLVGAPCSQPTLTVCGAGLFADCTVDRLGQRAFTWGVQQEPDAGADTDK